jgi:hypothetical protein
MTVWFWPLSPLTFESEKSGRKLQTIFDIVLATTFAHAKGAEPAES